MPASSATIGRIARGCGYDTIITTDADDSRARVQSWNPSVIVLDLNMPQMDGHQMMTWLAEHLCKARILIVSGREQELLREAEQFGRGLGLSIAGSIQKPLRVEGLRAVLREIYVAAGILSPQDLSKALENREIRLEYQPQIDMRSGIVIGFEALARWDHPLHGPIPPAVFIPDLEAHEIINDFTLHVLDLAMQDARKWQDLNVRISINVSAANFSKLHIDEIVEKKCLETGIDISRITIEVTESAAVENTGQIASCLERLHKLGAQVSIDDFGTGFSSLIKLHELPCAELKIDKSFVENCIGNQRSSILVQAMIDLGHSLNKRVVAEGVENERTMRQLDAWSCDIAQGFHISKSMPPNLVEKWFEEYASQVRDEWS
jgi:EAL domain-containing protein (putative c-di-GMP-specific phosphodiesterase class I)/CheY-like chemotaxis protein